MKIIKPPVNPIVEVIGKDLIELPKPFEREIYLFSTEIAGTFYIENINELVSELKVADNLNLFREINNSYDDQAIVMKNKDGFKLGYIPKLDNQVISRLMDAGKYLFAKVKALEAAKNKTRIEIDIYLLD